MLGQFAQSIRKSCHLTQEELGIRWDKSRVQITRYEKEGGTLPPLLADAYLGMKAEIIGKEQSVKVKFFPGAHGNPSRAKYSILMNRDSINPEAHIVAYQDILKGDGTSLYNTDEGRDHLLNSILDTELAGIRLDFIRFFVILNNEPSLECIELPIRLDVNDYCKKGNPHEVSVTNGLLGYISEKWKDKTISIHSVNITAGCAKFYTPFNERVRVEESVAKTLFEKAGF